MAEMNTIVEGNVKYRDGKKWKPRWCVMKKPSPVADRLLVHLFKDVKESIKGGSPKTSFPLDGFYGLESGICFDKETSVLAIICHKQITLLAFSSRETLIQFEIKIRRSLGEEHQFPVRTNKVPSHSKLPLDLLRMHIHGQKFCLTGQVPPKILGSWQVSELRRFGIIDGKFCFEGGSRCGKAGQGFHVLQTDQAEEISEILSHASSGKSAPLIRRQTSKRRSELVEPAKNVVSDNLFKKFQNTAVYLDRSAEEDNSWPRHKRHSISFTDYRRAKTYTEKQRLQSIENVEKERLMAIYDIPPRRVRKVESVQKHSENVQPPVRNYDLNKRNFMSQENDANMSWPGEYNNNVMSYQVPMTTTPSNQSDSSSSSHGSHLSLVSLNSLQQTMPMSSSAPVLCGYGNQTFTNRYREYSQSVPNQIAEEVNRVVGEARREEVLQRLQQTEADLEKEMSLLDEMLQLCQKTNASCASEESQSPPPLPVKLSALRDKLSDVLFARGSTDNISISSDNTHSRPLPQSGYTSSVLLSPNLMNKLKKIPKKSKMSAPLPYVNLSKYDIGDIDTNHVHLSASSTSAPDGGISSADLQRNRSRGYDNVPSDHGANKENKRISVSLPGSRENLRNISGSDLQLNVQNSSSNYTNEPIYANENYEPPPPELPPKGPALAAKLRQKRALNVAMRPPPPPRPPERHHSLQQPRGDRFFHQHQGSNPVSSSSSQEEDYFLMGNFEKEPTHCIMSYPESQRLNESLAGRPIVSLPPRGLVSADDDPNGCYMDMSAQMELGRSRSFNETDSSSSGSVVGTPRPKYLRSLSASGLGMKKVESPLKYQSPLGGESHCCSAGNSPSQVRREMPIREQNYMLMSTVSPKRPVLENLRSLQDYVSTTPAMDQVMHKIQEDSVQMRLNFGTGDLNDSARRDSCSTDERKVSDLYAEIDDSAKVEKPFDNLIDFTLQPENTKTTKNGANVVSEKTESSIVKTPGFFSRLIRRNSKDRKSISQSHENLLSSNSVEPPIKEGMAVLTESSSSGENSRSQSQQDLVFGPKDRNRSSSFPNRSSFIAMNESNSSSSTGISVLSQQSDLGATNSSLNSCGTVSTRASSNDCNMEDAAGESLMSDSEKEESKGNYDQQSYFFMGPLQNSENGKCEEDDTRPDTDSKSDEKDDDSKLEENVHDSEDSSKYFPDKHGGKVFTVLNVQGGNFDKDSCKTDDEKLIELWHSTHSLNLEKSDKISDLKSKLTLPLEELSPDEKANAIARHISSLPPFVPPKMKSYPAKLSPVLERVTPKKDHPDSFPGDKVESPVLSPSLMKQQAKATLRITPPSEDEHGKIWIPRSSVPSQEEQCNSIDDSDTKSTTLVVDVDALGETDSLSLSSLEGSSSYSEEVIRSSPASTILRPRSGKEYQKVERRRTLDDSNTTSPLTTPQSPATGSVFTFETSTFQSLVSNSLSLHGELHSPKKLAHSDMASLKSEKMNTNKAMYMNVDFSPPGSPCLPIEPVEPQLNYAEIDLSDSGRSETPAQPRRFNYTDMDLSLSERLGNVRQSKKSKKAAVEQLPIEYTMIDMVATRAAQKARKEHAQNRDGSLRRERPSLSFSGSRDSSASHAVKGERRQTGPGAVAQSSSSVESANG